MLDDINDIFRKNTNNSFVQNNLFLLIISFIGFTIYEQGGIRYKSYTFVSIKNLISLSMSLIIWWLIGFGFYFGRSQKGLIGSSLFAESESFSDEYERFELSGFYMIISLLNIFISVTERLDMITISIYSFLFSSIIFPIGHHWNNGMGWLNNLSTGNTSYYDITGVGHVHCLAAGSSLAMLLIVGQRLNKQSEEKIDDFKESNLQLLGLGSLLIWISRIGYNNACLYQIYQYNENFPILVGKTTMNTLLSPSVSSIVSYIIYYIFKRKTNERYSILSLTNGILTGLISVSAYPGGYPSWGAFVIGILSGLFYSFYTWIISKIKKIDDPLNILSVNLTGGTIGLVTFGWLDHRRGIVNGENAMYFGYQLLGVVVYLIWGFILTGIIMLLLKLCKIHRVNNYIETEGIDYSLCGGEFVGIDEKSREELKGQLIGNKEEKINQIAINDHIIETEKNIINKSKSYISKNNVNVSRINEDIIMNREKANENIIKESSLNKK